MKVVEKVLFLGFVVFLLILGGCDLFGPDVSGSGNPVKVSLEISPEGGDVVLPGTDGSELVRLSVPEGAVDSPVAITLSQLNMSQVASIVESGETRTLLGGFTGEPDGLTFHEPVTVTLQLTPSATPSGLPFHTIVKQEEGAFYYTPSAISYDLEELTISFEVEGFSTHSVVDVDAQSEINALLEGKETFSSDDITTIETFMESWFYSLVGKIGSAPDWITGKAGINEYLSWVVARQNLAGLFDSPREVFFDSLEAQGRQSIALYMQGEQDRQLAQLDNSANNSVYGILLDLQRSVDTLAWPELDSLTILSDELALLCGTLELTPSTLNIAESGEANLTAKIRDAEGNLFAAGSFADSLSWESLSPGTAGLSPGGGTAVVTGVAEGSTTVTVEVTFTVLGDKTITKSGIASITVGPELGPIVEGTSPLHLATEVSVDSAVSISFTEAMDTSSDSFYSISPAVAYTRVWSGGQTLLTLDPNTGLEPSTTYTVTLTDTAVSQSGTSLTGGYVFSFTTEEAPLSITNFYPEAGSTDVPVNTTILIEFSDSMDDVLTKDAFSIVPATDGILEWQDTGMTRLRFTSAANLEENTTYNFSIAESAANWDRSETIDSGYVCIFTTGEMSDTTAPVLLPDCGFVGCSAGESNSMRISVIVASDDRTNHENLVYDVYRSRDNVFTSEAAILSGAGTLIFSGSELDFDSYLDEDWMPAALLTLNDPGLMWETEYFYAVTVSDEAGNTTVYEPNSAVTAGQYDSYTVFEALPELSSIDYYNPYSYYDYYEDLSVFTSGEGDLYGWNWSDGVKTLVTDLTGVITQYDAYDYYGDHHDCRYLTQIYPFIEYYDENGDITLSRNVMDSGPPGDFSGSWTWTKKAVFEDGHEEVEVQTCEFTLVDDSSWSPEYEATCTWTVNGEVVKTRTKTVFEAWVEWLDTPWGWKALMAEVSVLPY